MVTGVVDVVDVVVLVVGVVPLTVSITCYSTRYWRFCLSTFVACHLQRTSTYLDSFFAILV